MKQLNIPVGLYRHFKGAYYFLQRVCKSADAPDEENPSGYICEYFNVLHPEKGFFTRKMSDWDSDVSHREDNVTGQTHRFELVKSLDGDTLKNYTTEHLLREIAGREDSPLQALGVENLSDCVYTWDFCVGEMIEAHDDKPRMVRPVAGFDYPKEAFEYLRNHYSQRFGVFKRTFIQQK